MKILKKILGTIWDVVYPHLQTLAQKTDTPWDNTAIEVANTVLRAWLDNEFEEDGD